MWTKFQKVVDGQVGVAAVPSNITTHTDVGVL